VTVGDIRRTGVVRAAKVADDGLSVTLTVEVDTSGEPLEDLLRGRSAMSFRIPPQ
jgi:hypothetical protein